jgi:hypothetical protein
MIQILKFIHDLVSVCFCNLFFKIIYYLKKYQIDIFLDFLDDFNVLILKYKI